MTDKQIIIYKKECYNEPHCSLNQVLEQLKAKEQECEELNAENIYLKDRVGKLERAILRRNEQLDQLKAENEQLHKNLTEIKEIVTCPRKIEATFNINNWIEIRNNILQKISEVEDEFHS